MNVSLCLWFSKKEYKVGLLANMYCILRRKKPGLYEREALYDKKKGIVKNYSYFWRPADGKEGGDSTHRAVGRRPDAVFKNSYPESSI
jgi:hypothetical protein